MMTDADEIQAVLRGYHGPACRLGTLLRPALFAESASTLVDR